MRKPDANAPIVLDQQFATGSAFGATGTPSAILIGPDGRIASEMAVGAPSVMALAHAAYDERLLSSGHLAPARLAVLADLLEEAGCSDQAVLEHLRHPGPHVRGCWPVDLLLATE